MASPPPRRSYVRREPDALCEIQECKFPRWRKGWCRGHYRRWRETGDTQERVPLRFSEDDGPLLGSCSVDSCDEPAPLRPYKGNPAFCALHMKRFRETGDPGPAFRKKWGKITDIYAYLHVYTATAPNGCWHFTGPLNKSGYGVIGVTQPDGTRANNRAHRVAWEEVNGPIPAGLFIDHVCHTDDLSCTGRGKECLHRRCVNPDHLEAVTPKDNTRRKNLACGYGHSRKYLIPTVVYACSKCESEHRYDATDAEH